MKVLKGDLHKAIETHQMLFEVAKKHTFLPEVRFLSHKLLCMVHYHYIINTIHSISSALPSIFLIASKSFF